MSRKRRWRYLALALVLLAGKWRDAADVSADGTVMEFSQIEVCGTACDDLGIQQSAEVQYFCNPG